MAMFCKTCGLDHFGKDHKDLAGVTTPLDTLEGTYARAICEGCGHVAVDHTGLVIQKLEPPRPRRSRSEFTHNNCGGALELDAPLGRRIFFCSKCAWRHELVAPNQIPLVAFEDQFVPGEWTLNISPDVM